MTITRAETRDRWAEWLLARRFGGDRQVMEETLARMRGWRDRILEEAALAEGETLLDVGAGDGLVAFGALAREPSCRVLFGDISYDLLRHSFELARDMGELARAAFVQAPAERLPLAAATVDVVTTRSVLIYVDDKAAAFAEFYRVLRPGGRISLFEPINNYFPREKTMWGFDLSPIWPIAVKVRALYEALQPPESDPMLNFDDRDLIALAEAAGFRQVTLTLEAGVQPWEKGGPWEAILHSAGNPKIPTLAEAMDEVLTAAEAEALIAYLRPLVEAGEGVRRFALAFLRAQKEA